MADIKLVRLNTEPAGTAYAVTPLGHTYLPTQAAINNYAFKWGLPQPGGNATIDVVASIDWIGPDYAKMLQTLSDTLDNVVSQNAQNNSMLELINGKCDTIIAQTS